MAWAIHQVATFSHHPFGGNPAYVAVCDRAAPIELLDGARRQLGEAVLAVLTPDDDGFCVDFVTGQGSHSGPGHSTHAAAWVAMNRLGWPDGELTLRVKAGGTRSVRREGGLIAVDWPVMASSPSGDRPTLERVLGFPLVEARRSEFGTIAVAADENAIRAMRPDFEAIAGIEVDTLIVTARSSAADFVLRVFAPRLGLSEDPVCGTAHRILAPYWAGHAGQRSLVSHQLSPRGGELFCRTGDGIVTIAGAATPFLEGTIEIPFREDAAVTAGDAPGLGKVGS